MSGQLTDLEKKQIAQAEELLFSGPSKEGFAKDLFFGKFRTDALMPFPTLESYPESVQQESEETVEKVRKYCQDHIDPVKIDREEKIPDEVIKGLGDLGVLGMTVGKENGGEGKSQYDYCRVMEIIGGHCGSTGVFVNAHHSIGLRALELFGTNEQKRRWMKDLATGEKVAAFALTEPEAGSDAGNVQTIATPDADGKGFTLNGEKRWITNGGIADVPTGTARPPDPAHVPGIERAVIHLGGQARPIRSVGFEIPSTRQPTHPPARAARAIGLTAITNILGPATQKRFRTTMTPQLPLYYISNNSRTDQDNPFITTFSLRRKCTSPARDKSYE